MRMFVLKPQVLEALQGSKVAEPEPRAGVRGLGSKNPREGQVQYSHE